MFNSGFRGKRAVDGTGAISTQTQSVQATYPVPKINSWSVTDSNYVPYDDTAAAIGSTVVVYGNNFVSNMSVFIGTASVSVTLLDSNRITFTTPSLTSGVYNIYLVTSQGGGAILSPGITISGFPSWTTSSYNSISTTLNVQLLATGDGPLTYSLQAGSTLPTGITLTSTGLLTGSATGVTTQTAFTFVVIADDAQLQSTQQAIVLTFLFDDPQFKYTTLLLNGETSVTPFIKDSSTNNFDLTINGDTRAIPFNPYQEGYYSNYFDGTGDYLTAASNTWTTLAGSFTIEFWVNFNAIPTANPFVGVSSAGGLTIYNDGTRITPNIFGTGNIFNSTLLLSSLTTGIWYHIAVTRNSSNLMTIWLNGVDKGSATTATTYTQGTWQIGNTNFNCYMSNLRVTNTCVYTTAFTPPTTPLTAISGTSLLTCQSNRIIDNSTNAFTITKNGDTTVSSAIPFTADSSYNTYGSAYFDGIGDYLSIPDNVAFTLGSNDFTFECWVYPTSITNGNNNILAQWGNGNAWIFRYVAAGRPQFSGAATNVTGTTTAVTINQWNHVAITRTSGTVRLFVNGVLDATSGTIGALTDGASQVTIGAYSDGTSEYVTGYISNLRLINGTSLYTTTFTPPTTPLTAITNTSLLTLQYNGSANNSGIIDNSTFNNIITRTGNTTQGSFSPFSQTGWSTYFNGSTDYMYSSGGAGVGGTSFGYGTGDFTWECWIHPLSSTWTSGNFYICDHGSNGGVMQYNANVFRYYNGGTAYDSAAGLIPNGVWTHIAVSRISGFTTTYINGIVAKASTADSKDYGTSNQFWLARYGAGGNIFPGYISNFRIVKGVGVYTGAFTPSTTPLTATQGAGTNINAITTQTTLLTCQNNRHMNNSSVPLSFDGGTTLGYSGTPLVQAFSPFGSIGEPTPNSYSYYFDGTGDYITGPSNTSLITTGQFTFECWVYTTSTALQTIMENAHWDIGQTGGFRIKIKATTGYIELLASPGTYNTYPTVTTSTSGVAINTWTHVAVTRDSSNNIRIFLNGSLVSTPVTYANSLSLSSDGNIGQVKVGMTISDGGTYEPFIGYISNLRVIQGTCLYTASFTLPTSALTAVSGTVFLTCQSTTIIDNSSNAFALTGVGDAKPRPANPFGYSVPSTTAYTPSIQGGSIYYDGTGDYISSTSTRFAFGATNDFTAECWAYFTVVNSAASPGLICVANAGTSNGWEVFYDTGTWGVRSNVANVFGSTGSPPTPGQWYHVAYVRKSGTHALYVNGIRLSTSATSYTWSDTVFYSGYVPIGQPVYGYVSNLRLVNGTCLYSNNFYPSNQPLTNYSATVLPTLLLNFTNGGIVDQHSGVVLETVGNSQLSTSVKKFGTSSMYFDGTGDYLSIPTNQLMNFGTGDFTVEAWVYPNSLAGAGWFIISASGSGGFFFGYSGTDIIGYGFGRAIIAWDYRVAGSATAGVWQHVAVTRSGTSMRMFVNGTQIGTTQTISTAYDMSTTSTTVGSQGAANYLNGYIDDLRVTKGFARYTANFTAPTTTLLVR